MGIRLGAVTPPGLSHRIPGTSERGVFPVRCASQRSKGSSPAVTQSASTAVRTEAIAANSRWRSMICCPPRQMDVPGQSRRIHRAISRAGANWLKKATDMPTARGLDASSASASAARRFRVAKSREPACGSDNRSTAWSSASKSSHTCDSADSRSISWVACRARRTARTGPRRGAGFFVRKVNSYLNDTVVLSMVSCVGCYWGRCIFCSYGNRSLERGAYQQASPGQLADTVCRIVKSTGIDFVTVVDENTNLLLLVRAMRLVRERGLRVRFNTRNRLEPILLDSAFCQELAELGCEGMAVGYEGVTQRLLFTVLDLRIADFGRQVGVTDWPARYAVLRRQED
ncbi:hypothetical protein [Streptomyces chrestomyceticus]|uniref:hypothetical protein n=1 Tax=Streptomyces chrestomyceticus TaxID=68185 RepID=UPI0037B39B15